MPLDFLYAAEKVGNLIFSDDTIRYVETKITKVMVVTRYEERQLPPGYIVQGRIMDISGLQIVVEDCVREWKLKRKEVRLVVPDAVALVRKVPVPSAIESDEIEGYLFLELGSSIHLPFEQAVFDYTLLPIRGETKEIILYAAPEDVMVSYMRLLENEKVKPITADLSGLALYRLFDHFKLTRKKQHEMVVHLGVTTMTVTMFANQRPMFMRHVTFENGDKWERQLGRGKQATLTWTGTDEEQEQVQDELLTELERMINYYRYSFYATPQQVDRIFVTGDHPQLEQLFEALTNRFDIDVVTLEEMMLKTVRGQAIPPAFHLACGLALKEWDNED